MLKVGVDGDQDDDGKIGCYMMMREEAGMDVCRGVGVEESS